MMENRVAPFTLPSPERPLAPPLMRLEDVSVGYDGAPVLRKLNLRLDTDDRIGLLGVNGAGKSTFAKLAAGALPPLAGHMHRDRRIKVGWFHQHQIEALDPKDTPLEIIRRAMPEASESSRRSRLAQFGLGFDKQETTVADLSGGERARLLLNLVAMEAPHLLILDEPTNHLDIDSRRALLDALNDYDGAVILITHDRSLMELVADRLWLADGGTVRPFDGDMDDYAKLVIDRAKGQSQRLPAEEKATPAPSKSTPAAAGRPRVSISTLRHRLAQAEQALAGAHERVSSIDAALADPGLFGRDPARAAALGRDRANAADALALAEAAWLEAAEALHEVEGA
jgi:ATP-binding cassette subfamily F protein 3